MMRSQICQKIGVDACGQSVADCYRADGASVSNFMVRSGWALDWPRYSKGAYAGEQDEARRGGAGIWRGSFVKLWEAWKAWATMKKTGTL